MTSSRDDKTAKPIDAPVLTEHNFWRRVEKTDTCWIWVGPVSDGYGMTRHNDRPVRAHRLAYAAVNGPIPRGLLVCHSCDIPRCVNPAHLWLGTPQDNDADKRAKGRDLKTRCIRGHLFTPETTYVQPNGAKRCRQCQREYERANQAKRYAARKQAITRQRSEVHQ